MKTDRHPWPWRLALFVIAPALLLAVGAGVARGETYEYDDAGRLTRVEYDDGSFVEYVYDPAGNVLAAVTRPGPGDVSQLFK